MKLAMLCLGCMGCDRIFALDHVQPTLDAEMVCIDDPFSGTTLDARTWGTFSSATTVSVADQLIFTLAAQSPGNNYAGVYTFHQFDFTSGIVSVEMVMPPDDVGAGGLSLFVLGTTGATETSLTIRKIGASLQLTKMLAGAVADTLSVAFSATSDHYLRLAHMAGTDMLSFQTSLDGSTWTERHSVAMSGISATSLGIELFAGTFDAEPPSTVSFDNLVVATPNCVTR